MQCAKSDFRLFNIHEDNVQKSLNTVLFIIVEGKGGGEGLQFRLVKRLFYVAAKLLFQAFLNIVLLNLILDIFGVFTLEDQIIVLTRTVFMTKCPLDTGLFDTNTHTRGASRASKNF